MKKTITAAILTFGVLAYGGFMYNKGKEDGKNTVLALMDFANKVVEVVNKTEEEA